VNGVWFIIRLLVLPVEGIIKKLRKDTDLQGDCYGAEFGEKRRLEVSEFGKHTRGGPKASHGTAS
jgi:hypothetical protein